MNYLLDTNVLAEWVKPHPNVGVVRWLDEVDEDRVHISVITLAEIRHGIARMPAGARRRRLDDWLTNDLSARFQERVLSVGPAIADRWGRIVASCSKSGRPISAMDAFVAATAQHHGMELVTRNGSDFAAVDIELLDPWAG
jgi:hypothetical protein